MRPTLQDNTTSVGSKRIYATPTLASHGPLRTMVNGVGGSQFDAYVPGPGCVGNGTNGPPQGCPPR